MVICDNCGKVMGMGTAIGSYYCPNCGNYKNNQIQKVKDCILAYNLDARHGNESIILIDENNKTVATFLSDGCKGISLNEVKGILNFLGIKYVERVYDEFPEYIEEYKEYDWRSVNGIIR